jgi:hypothetical protein
MSHDGGGKPGKGPGRRAMSLNGMPLSVTRAATRIARNVSQQGVGAGKPAATMGVRPAWARCDGVEVPCGSADVTS